MAAQIDIKTIKSIGDLEQIAHGPININNEGDFNFKELQGLFSPESIVQKDILIHIEYLPKEDRYEFAIYQNKK